MKNLSRLSHQARGLRLMRYVPNVETLEARQPVSDALFGGMLAWSIFGSRLSAWDALPTASVSAASVSLRERQETVFVPADSAYQGGFTEDQVGRSSIPSAHNLFILPPVSENSIFRLPEETVLAGKWLPRVAPRLSSSNAGLSSESIHDVGNIDPQSLTKFSPVSEGNQSEIGTGRATDKAILAAVNAPDLRPSPTPAALEGYQAPSSSAATLPATPVSFEMNAGQADPAVRFLSRGPGYTLFLTSQEMVLRFGSPPASAGSSAAGVAIQMWTVGANPAPQITGLDQLPGHVNYFLGNDPANWHPNVPTFAGVQYQGVYPGIDLIFHGSGGQPEYDFVVAPGADPATIRLNFGGADGVAIDSEGALEVRAGSVQFRQSSPIAYQEENGVRQSVASAFRLDGQGQVGFTVGAFDPSKPLVIDPYFGFSTYLGGSANDQGWGIATNLAGNVFVTGFTESFDFPCFSPGVQQCNPYHSPRNNDRDVFVSKFAVDGQSLQYTTILGGDGRDEGRGIAVDNQDNAYVTGFTESFNFPTVNAYQAERHGRRDAFVTALDPNGFITYSTYLGGFTGMQEGRGIAVDANQSAYLTGITSAVDFPIQNADQLQPAFGGGPGTTDAFVTKFRVDGPLDFSTFLGGSGNENIGFSDPQSLAIISGGIAVDAAGNAFVTGTTTSTDFPIRGDPFQGNLQGTSDAFLTEIANFGDVSAFVYSTYLGGPLGATEGHGIAVCPADSIACLDGGAYVTGATTSPNFPVFNAAQPIYGGNSDAFVTWLVPNESQPRFSTYLGGPGQDRGNGITVTTLGSVYVVGETTGQFPTRDALQPTFGGGQVAIFATKLQVDGSRRYSTYVGGRIDDRGRAVARIPYTSTSPLCGRLTSSGPDVNPCDDEAAFTGISAGGYPTENAFQSNFGGPPYDAIVTTVPDCTCKPTNVHFTPDTPVHLTWDDPCEDYTTEYVINYKIDGVPQAPIIVTPPAPRDVYLPGDPGTYEVTVQSHNSCCDAPPTTGTQS